MVPSYQLNLIKFNLIERTKMRDTLLSFLLEFVAHNLHEIAELLFRKLVDSSRFFLGILTRNRHHFLPFWSRPDLPCLLLLCRQGLCRLLPLLGPADCPAIIVMLLEVPIEATIFVGVVLGHWLIDESQVEVFSLVVA